MWPATADPSPLLSWKYFSLSMCFEGGGGIAELGGGGGGGEVIGRYSGDGFTRTGRISGRFSISPGMVPSSPNGGRSTGRSSSSGTAQAFPFRNLSREKTILNQGNQEWSTWNQESISERRFEGK